MNQEKDFCQLGNVNLDYNIQDDKYNINEGTVLWSFKTKEA